MFFSGWSTNPDANGNKQYTSAVYTAGTLYDMPDKNITLYAAWAQENVDAEFYIRLDGSIPTEPQEHEASEYTQAIKIANAIKIGTFYTNSTPPGVEERLNTMPSPDQIKKVIDIYNSKVTQDKRIIYNSNTQYVLWYVIKREDTWHVDGVLLQKELVNLAYNANAPAGTWDNMPDGQQYTKGSTATVSGKIPTRTGYTFVGWNTDAGGNGTWYESNDKITINESITLYAQWSAGRTEFSVNHWIQKINTSGSQEEDFEQYGKTEKRRANTDSLVSDSSYKLQIPGFIYEEAAIDGISQEAVKADNSTVLNLYYLRKNNLGYTVKYYKDSIEEKNYLAEENGTGTFGEVIQADLSLHVPEGYAVPGTRSGAEKISADGGDVVNVVYSKKTNLGYTVKYYKDSIEEKNYLAE
ncbi:MAG: InlB B-repeat-containing protein, partial [Clostridia bacterium]|nr:InlB B-repeat-containing protein [Clostridia bacterium]